jgi:hypothetical protein
VFVALGIQCGMRMPHIVISDLLSSTILGTHYLKTGVIFENAKKVNEYEMCALIFTTTSV